MESRRPQEPALALTDCNNCERGAVAPVIAPVLEETPRRWVAKWRADRNPSLPLRADPEQDSDCPVDCIRKGESLLKL
jgi:hypothetical protein